MRERQLGLFPDPATVIKVGRRSEPSVWLRRLVIWSKPGEMLREVTFRRGLNVVWSPDPGTRGAAPGVEEESGHAAGKSLLCRLVRFCLGEATFADADLRDRIGSTFPEGRVGLQVRVDGVEWGVVRPLGITRKCLVDRGTLEEVVAADRTASIDDWIAEIGSATVGASLDALMPDGGKASPWLFALAWLARDQENRFAHLLGWRHASAEARSPAAGSSKEDLTLIVRLLLGAVNAGEFDLRSRAAELDREHAKRERECEFLRETAVRAQKRVTTDTPIDASLLSTESLGSRALSRWATERLQAAEAAMAAAESSAEQDELRGGVEGLVAEVATLEAQLKRLEGLHDLHSERLRVLNGERSNLTAEQIKARLGPTCPVCAVPIDEALARGCGIALPGTPLPDLVTQAKEKDRDIQACRDAITNFGKEVADTGSVHEQRVRQLAEARKRVETLELALRAARKARQASMTAASRLADGAAALERVHHDLARERAALARVTKAVEKLDQELKDEREAHSAVLKRFEKLFQYVMQGLLHAGAGAELALHANGFRAHVDVGGTAMESLKVVGFDLAAMLMAIEGRGVLPALLIHDSPREADLGGSYYAKLFKLARSLEDLGTEPPFQYIITTTTEPPSEIATSDAVVLRLRGLDPEQRLLRRAL